MDNESLLSHVQDCFTGNFMNNLESMWAEYGFSTEKQDQRRQSIYEKIKDTCQLISRDEHEAYTRTTKKQTYLHSQLAKLAQELDIEEPVIPSDALLRNIELCEAQITILETKKLEHLKIYHDLLDQEKVFVELLGVARASPIEGNVPTEREIRALELHLAAMGDVKRERKGQFMELKKNILKLLVRLEEAEPQYAMVSPEDEGDMCLTLEHLASLREQESDFEYQLSENQVRWEELREELTRLWGILKQGEEPSPLLNTTYTPSAIRALESEVKALRTLRSQNIDRFIAVAREELTALCGECYVEPVEATGEENSESSLQLLEDEHKRLAVYKKQHAVFFQLLGGFRALFSDLLVLERKARDPKRLFNTRGGALLAEEKERKRLKVELPRYETRLNKIYNAYAPHTAPLIHGLPLAEWLEQLWGQHASTNDVKKTPFRPGKENLRAAGGTKRLADNDIKTQSEKKSKLNVAGQCNIAASSSYQDPMQSRPNKSSKLALPQIMVSQHPDITLLNYEHFQNDLKSSKERINSTTISSLDHDSL